MSGRVCDICGAASSGPSRGMYCGSQHGVCGSCGDLRYECVCIETSTMAHEAGAYQRVLGPDPDAEPEVLGG